MLLQIWEFYKDFILPATPLFCVFALLYVGLRMIFVKHAVEKAIKKIEEQQEAANRNLGELRDIYQNILERHGRETHQRARLSALLREIERRLDTEGIPKPEGGAEPPPEEQ
ncbi:MAG: hypothetical protein NUW37_01930 [Planctomycetes bacterium]|nr:hypothetical protein [Planctomycetota bacterium]